MRNYHLHTSPESHSPYGSLVVDGDSHSLDVDGNFTVYKNTQLVAYVPSASLVSVEIRGPRR